MSVAVVIPTRSRPATLVDRCVAAVRASGHEGRVVVVDGNDQPLPLSGDVEIVRYPRASASGARNAGLETLTEDIVCFTDDDCIPAAGWVAAARRGLSQAPMVTGRTLPWCAASSFDEKLPLDRGAMPRLFTGGDLSLATLVGETVNAWQRRHEPYTARATTPFAVGAAANLAAWVPTLRRLGGFNEAFGTASCIATGEDTELFLRTLLAGESILYQPEMRVCHDDNGRDPDLAAIGYAQGGGAALAFHGNLYLWGVLLAKYPESVLRREGPWRPFLSAWTQGLRSGLRLRRGSNSGRCDAHPPGQG